MILAAAIILALAIVVLAWSIRLHAAVEAMGIQASAEQAEKQAELFEQIGRAQADAAAAAHAQTKAFGRGSEDPDA